MRKAQMSTSERIIFEQNEGTRFEVIELTEFGRHAQPSERTERTRRGSIRFSRLRSEAVSCDVCRPKERVWREPNIPTYTPFLALRPRRGGGLKVAWGPCLCVHDVGTRCPVAV